MLSKVFSLTSFTFLIAVFYLYMVGKQMYQLMNPLHRIVVSGPTVDPLWEPLQKFSFLCFLSNSQRFSPFAISEIKKSDLLLTYKNGISFDPASMEDIITLQIVESHSFPSETKTNQTTDQSRNVTLGYASAKVWKALRSNSSAVYLHVLVIQDDMATDEVTTSLVRSGRVLYGVINMIKFDPIPKSFRHRYLLEDFGWNMMTVDPIDVLHSRMAPDTVISYWKPEVAVRLVTDFTRYPVDHVPQAIMASLVQPKQSGRQGPYPSYAPPLHADEIGLTTDKYVPLNASVTALPLKLSFGPMSLQRWLLMQHMEQSISSQAGLGFSDKDVDDVRRLISDTSVYLLGVTFLASLLHLLFEALAFQSDIAFWHNNKSLAGLSPRTVITDLLSQSVVFLFLLESDTSLLVTIPAFLGILIQMWKVRRATGLCLRWAPGRILPSLHFSRWEAELAHHSIDTDKKGASKVVAAGAGEVGSHPAVEGIDHIAKVTLEADRYATSHLSLLLLPLILGLCARSLITERHRSWYSWGIGALTACVYTLGFIMMCPQLFINHRLKSVAFLPWRFLAFRFINTFIDDLFAFIIKMPTMHRISCFRDDIVFLVYIYQRWIYRVDESRPVEK